MFEYTCSTWDNFPIQLCTVIIHAIDREHADNIFNKYGHQIFDQGMNVTVREVAKGYRQVEEKT